MNNAEAPEIELESKTGYWAGRFSAMASPCEILADTADGEQAESLTRIAADEARRIERKFSRYRDDNIVHRINNSGGEPVEVDGETAELLDFADTLYELSNGMFDITSGVLREAWRFDGGDRIPDNGRVRSILNRVGWTRAHWEKPVFTLPAGMQIDLGGIGKEYAVDRCIGLLRAQYEIPCLINFGGDLAVTGPRDNDRAWHIGIESTESPGRHDGQVLALKQGAIATSGDVRRYLLKDGVRYGHILNPKSGWPVDRAPRSVTVAANTCTEAGMLATLAMLKGGECERFLEGEGVRYWCLR